MSLIAFDPRAPEISRLAGAAARGAGRGLGFVANAIGSAALRAARRRRLELSLFAGLAVALAGAGFFFDFEAAEPRPAPVVSAPPPAWVDAARPLPMFSFDAPEFARAPSSYTMRRHSTGGGREDVMTFGSFAGPDPYLRLVVYQVGAEASPRAGLFVETARRAAEAGLALDGLSGAVSLPTRFGAAEWAEARIAAPGDAAPRAGCAVVRFSADEPQLRVFGVACGPEGTPFPRKQMSCLIGRLDLSAAGEDPDLQRFFARSELARDAACAPGTRSRISGPAPAPAPKPKPALRAAIAR
jgi:hypothetical protein